MSTVFESVVDVITKRFRIDRSSIHPEISFEELGLDSLSQIELITALQKELRVAITDDDIVSLSLVSDVVRLLENRRLGV
jgi:acyl carrier protein